MKKIKILTILLAIILISVIAFFGVYTQVQNRMENQVKDYSYAMDLKGTRSISLKVNKENKTTIKDSEGNEVTDSENLTDEEMTQKGYTKEEIPYNSEDVLTVDNYKKAKEIIEKRLKKLNVDYYDIKLDEQTGSIVLEVTENDKTDNIVSNLNTTGKFEIIDTETKEVLMDNNDIKRAAVMYGSNSSSTTSSSGTSVYLDIEFNRDGAKKLEDIGNKYVKNSESSSDDTNTTSQENTTGEDQNTDETDSEKEKTITMKIDDEEIMSTGFEEPIKTGKLQLSVGQASTDQDTLQGYVDQATSMATVLDTGDIPIKYEVDENEYVASDITKDDLQVLKYIAIGVIALALIVLCIRYKTNGIVGAISFVGLFALLMLLIRYTNVIISIGGLFGIALVLVLEYIFINKILNKIKQKSKEDLSINKILKETYGEFIAIIIPIAIAIITFCFTKWVPISSLGMIMFWGISLILIYNFVIIGSLLKIKVENK